MKISTASVLLGLSLLAICACKRKNDTKPNYDFTYTGSLYTGDSALFSLNAGTNDVVNWYFGNKIFESTYLGRLVEYENWPCDTCDVQPSTPFTCDVATGKEIKHVYFTPGTYSVTATINRDTINKVKKTIKVLSPEELNTEMKRMRHWVRTGRDWNEGGFDSTYALPDTSFALNVLPGVCTSPFKSFPFRMLKSSSSMLVYEFADDPHYAYKGNIRFNRQNDSIFIQERNIGIARGYRDLYYRSGL